MKNTQTPFIIENKIFLIRGFKVMLDSDLAELYGITTYNLNKAVKRNMSRFPADFMFQLSKEEFKNLIFQFGISSLKHGGKRHLPFVFSEHGVTMLSSVLRSERAVQMNIFIVRAFIKMRELLSTHKDLAQKMAELERTQREQGNQLSTVYSIVKQLVMKPVQTELPKPKKIGFRKD
jgi:phage regulator Rha-like protein